MIKVENDKVWGFEHAIRGMRNPKNSWGKSDSWFSDGCYYYHDITGKRTSIDSLKELIIGENDLSLMKRLYKAGPEHRKYLRQIFVSMDITAPLYWWKEFDTYKIGTTADSCSTMHKIHAKAFELDDFSHEHMLFTNLIPTEYFESGKINSSTISVMNSIIDHLNECREIYIKTKDKEYWWQMIQLLPSSYNQKRTVTFTYENVVSMIRQRTGHKLTEWEDFCIILKELPYIREIMEI